MTDDKIIKRGEKLVALFNSAPIKHTFGMALRYDNEGSAVFELPYNPGLDHALHGIHGGAIATLIDNAGWFTVAARHDTWIATVEFQTRLLEPVEKEKLISGGWLVGAGKSLSIAGMEVKTQQGRLIAVGSGTFAVTSVPFS